MFLICLVAGFGAQLIDGSLGMGYGIILSIMLTTLGLSPVSVSASVHMAKFFATGVSGYSHLKFGNVDKGVAARLALGGVLGAILGTIILTSVPGKIIQPIVAVYLTAMGCIIVFKALNKKRKEEESHRIVPLGMLGGFFDAIGGGGWGAIVTSRLLIKGKNPRMAIGSVSLSEFFVSVTIVGLLVSEIPQMLTQVQMIVGLILGSALAAPLAAFVCGRVRTRPLMIAVGSLIIVLSGSTVLSALLALTK
jgi:uncharacterized protein